MSSIKKTCFLISFCFIIVFTIHGQNQNKADSIRKVIESSDLSGDEKLDAYHKLSNYTNSPIESIEYGDKLLELAQAPYNLEYILKANNDIGIGHRFLGNISKALEYQFKCANDAVGKEEFLPFLAEVYSEISNCYTLNGDSKNALLFDIKTINLLRKANKKQELALSLLNAGYDYYLIEEYDSAINYYEESELLLKEVGLKIGLAYIQGNRALVYWKKGDTKKAKEDLLKAIQMLKPIGDLYGIADYYNQLARIFLDEENDDQVVLYSMKSLKISEMEGLKEQARDASELLSIVYEKNGDYKKAMYHQSQFFAYRDSIQNLETTQRLAELRVEFEVAQKQEEVNLLLEQKQSNYVIMMVGGIIFLVFFFIVILRKSRSNTEAT